MENNNTLDLDAIEARAKPIRRIAAYLDPGFKGTEGRSMAVELRAAAKDNDALIAYARQLEAEVQRLRAIKQKLLEQCAGAKWDDNQIHKETVLEILHGDR